MPGQDRYVALPNGSYIHVPGDATPEQLSALRTKLQGTNSVNQSLSKATSVIAPPKPFTKEWFQQGLWRAGAGTADLAPAAGATAGGMIGAGGGPLSAVGGAGMGGMGGAALQQILRRMLGFPDVPQTSGEAAKDIAKQGTEQAAVQGLTELMPGAGRAVEGAAEKQYARALYPTTKEAKVLTRKVAPELIRRGEWGGIDSLMNTAKEKIDALRPELDVAYGRTPTTATAGSGTKIMQELDALKSKYIVNGQPAAPQAIKAIEGVQDIIRAQGADIDPKSLRKLKQIFDPPVAHGGGFIGADLSTHYTLQAQKAAADSIRDLMGKANPDVAALNKEISFWLNVQKVTSESRLRQVGQQGGLVKVLTPLAAGGAASTTGLHFGPTAGIEAGVGVALATAAAQMVRSPAWRTLSAIGKDRIAMALARGDVQQVAALGARLGLAGVQSAFGAGSQPPGQEAGPAQGRPVP